MRLEGKVATDITASGAGSLVRMAEGQSTTHKLTKRLAEMGPIEELIDWIQTEVARES